MLLKKVQINFEKMNSVVDTLVETVRGKFPLDQPKEYKIKLVSKELLTNILAYSDAENILLSAGLTKGVLTIKIEDNGSGFAHDSLLERDCAEGENLLKENGRGVFLVRMMSDGVSYNEKGNVVQVTIDLNDADPE